MSEERKFYLKRDVVTFVRENANDELAEKLVALWNIDKSSTADHTLDEVYAAGLDQLNPEESMTPELKTKFDRYLALLSSRGFFNGVDDGSEAYWQRYKKAKIRFIAKYKSENKQGVTSNSAQQSPTTSPTATTQNVTDPAERTRLSLEHKARGNQFLAQRKYKEAVAEYTTAIDFDSKNHIFYANRAASYSHLGEHQKAVSDCLSSITINSNYAKAWSRLGLAYFSLNKFTEAVNSYKKALELDPSNESTKNSLRAAEARANDASNAPASAPGATPAAGANPLAGFDFMQFMKDPNFMNMAASMLQNPNVMESIKGMTSNPEVMSSLRNMAQSPDFMSGVQNMMNNNGLAGDAPTGGETEETEEKEVKEEKDPMEE